MLRLTVEEANSINVVLIQTEVAPVAAIVRMHDGGPHTRMTKSKGVSDLMDGHLQKILTYSSG